MFRSEGYIDVPLPAQIHAPHEASNVVFHVRNGELSVITEKPRSDQPSKRKSALGIWYRNTSTPNWKNIATSGEVEIRGFGRWFSFTDRKLDSLTVGRKTAKTLAEMIEDRPGRANHTREKRVTGPGMASIFEGFESDGKPWNYAGSFWIVDSAGEGHKWRLETGNENSEILLIDRQMVVYRIEDSIWRGVLDPSADGISNAVRVASDPRLVDAHWAFFSTVEAKN